MQLIVTPDKKFYLANVEENELVDLMHMLERFVTSKQEALALWHDYGEPNEDEEVLNVEHSKALIETAQKYIALKESPHWKAHFGKTV